MTVMQWILFAVFIVLWLLAGAVVFWSVWALLTGRLTTSGYMAAIRPSWIVFAGFLAGFAVNFVASHWWFPSGRLRYAALGTFMGLTLGALAGAIVWPVSKGE